MRGEPDYPARSWWLALEAVESRDTMRRVRAGNDELWPRSRRREAHLLRKRDAVRLELRHRRMREVGRQKAVAQALAIHRSQLNDWLAARQAIPLKYCAAIERLLTQNNGEVIAL